MHRRGHCNEAHHDRSQLNKVMLASLVSLMGGFNGCTRVTRQSALVMKVGVYIIEIFGWMPLQTIY